MFANRGRPAIGIGALAVVLVVASLLVVTAALADTPPATATPTTQKTSYRQVFVEKLAAALGIGDVSKVQTALKDAAKGTVDQAVTNGDLAKNRADKIKTAIDQGKGSFFGGIPKPPAAVKKPVATLEAQVGNVSTKAIADKLGLDLATLRAQLRAGKSLTDLATAKGLTVQDLYNAAADAAKARLDPVVKAGKLTQARADEIVQAVREGRLINLDVMPKAPTPTAPTS